jgi:phosphopantetheinyl transferase
LGIEPSRGSRVIELPIVHLWLRDLPPQSAGARSPTDGWIRSILARELTTQESTISFERMPGGKPILSAHSSRRQLEFSLSHTDTVAALAVCSTEAVGIDIEEVREVPYASRIARRYFFDDEIAILEKLPTVRLSSRFLDFWVAKEAAIKWAGATIASDLRGCELRLSDTGQVVGAKLLGAGRNAARPRVAHIHAIDVDARWRCAIATASAAVDVCHRTNR